MHYQQPRYKHPVETIAMKVTVGPTAALVTTITPVQVAAIKKMDAKTMLPFIINKVEAHVGAIDERGGRIIYQLN